MLLLIDYLSNQEKSWLLFQMASCKCGSSEIPDSWGKFRQEQRVGAQKQNLKNAASLEQQQMWANWTAEEKLQCHGWKNKKRQKSFNSQQS